MRRLASPAFTLVQGLFAFFLGVLYVVGDREVFGFLFLGIGLVAVASGAVRHAELRRDKRYTGVLGAVAWLSTPVLWARYWSPRPPAEQAHRQS
jgi:hypothetical protein